MPNWVKNIISFESPDLELIKSIKSYLGMLDFDQLIPRPKTLNITSGSDSDYAFNLFKAALTNDNNFDKRRLLEFPILTDGEVIVDLKDSIYIDIIGTANRDVSYLYTKEEFKDRDPKCRGDLYILGKIQYLNIMKHGFRDWYGFNNYRWGTKWSSCYQWDSEEERNFYKEFKDDKGYMIKYTFRTAWNIPDGIYNEILFHYGYNKNLKINIQYIDEINIDYCGWLVKDYLDMPINILQMRRINIDDYKKYYEFLWSQ